MIQKGMEHVEHLLAQMESYFGSLPIHSFVTDDTFRVLWLNAAAVEFEPPLALHQNVEPFYREASDPNWKQCLKLPKTAFSFTYYGMHFNAAVQRLPSTHGTLCYLWHWTRVYHAASDSAGEQLLFSQRMIGLLRERVFHIHNNLLPLGSELDRLDAYEDYTYLNAITRDCQVLIKNIINSELYAQVVNGTLTPHAEYFFPALEFQTLSIYLQKIFSGTEREITVTVDPEAGDPVLFTDWYLLMICLLNLLCNAVEHTPEEGEIELSLRRLGDRVSITVRDDGDGMDPEIRNRALEEMYSFNTVNQRVENFGLGLYLCNHLIHRMGGTLLLTSEELRGTLVTLSLPVTERPAHKLPGGSQLIDWGLERLSPLYAFLAPLSRMNYY